MSVASHKTLVHFGQCVAFNKFQNFDHGEETNLIKYGQSTPPIYDPKIIKVPISVYFGGLDTLTVVTDLDEIYNNFLTILDVYQIPKYNHIDFFTAEDVVEQVYEKLVLSLNKYNNLV